MTKASILIVEDEAEIRDMLRFTLERADFEIVEAETAEDALQQLHARLPDLLLVDWMLPGISGVELVRLLRKDEITQGLPLIMLTARGEEHDKLTGFDHGVDDFMTKPFSPKELLARIKALLRRSRVAEDDKLVAGQMILDLGQHLLTIDGKNVDIGPTEYRLLEFFMEKTNRVYSREQLLDRVWGRNVYVEERTVDVHILRLRKLLTPYGCDGWIKTVRGAGYRFSPEQDLANNQAR
ncbi:MAG: phosphate regulon transcriptional regulator PhoB [Gammaproteobacteria bacterium]|nr:phosphate regulon transcriptional regulator PhoB [Gammaproteobacteria bacterium]